MKVNDLVNRQYKLKQEESDLDADWDKLAEEFLDKPYVSEFLKMNNAFTLNFDYLDMNFNVDSGTIKLYVWWRNCSEKEFLCRIDPKELDKFMTDDEYMIGLLKEKATKDEQQRIDEETKKKAERYELYKKLKEEFERAM